MEPQVVLGCEGWSCKHCKRRDWLPAPHEDVDNTAEAASSNNDSFDFPNPLHLAAAGERLHLSFLHSASRYHAHKPYIV